MNLEPQYDACVLSALVLTAGIGSRLDPLTRLVAKPAVPVAGRSLVERVLAWLHREGLRQVVLNLHHRPETITGVIGDGAHLGMRVRYSWEQPLLGSAGGPRRALPLLDADTFLIVNGDTLCDFPLAPMIAAHRDARADVTMALIPNPAPDRYNRVVLDATGRVTGFVPKGTSTHTTDLWHFVGVQIVRSSLFSPLPDGVPAETVSSLYKEGLGAGTLKVLGYPAKTSFVDVGTPADYLGTALQLSGNRSVVETGAIVDGSASLAGTVVWSDAHVGANARLQGCIVAGPVRVPAGFSATSRVIVPAAVLTSADRADVHDGLAMFAI